MIDCYTVSTLQLPVPNIELGEVGGSRESRSIVVEQRADQGGSGVESDRNSQYVNV